MSGIRFALSADFASELMADPETKEMMAGLGEKALEAAKAAVPDRTGRTRESYFFNEDGLGSTSSFWALMEYGDVHNPPYAPLRKGVEAAGLVMEDAE